MQIFIKKLDAAAVLPKYAHTTDAGLDLCTIEDFSIKPQEYVQVKTGLAIKFPYGYAALTWDKSGISHKRNLKVVGGVFDTDYRGEYLIGLYNFGTEIQSFMVGDKIAQILIQKVEHPEIVEVDELDQTARGAGAFGSTGA